MNNQEEVNPVNMYRVSESGQRIPHNVVPVEFQRARRITPTPEFAPPRPDAPVQVSRFERIETIGWRLLVLGGCVGWCVLLYRAAEWLVRFVARNI